MFVSQHIILKQSILRISQHHYSRGEVFTKTMLVQYKEKAFEI
jgi:hypothetical protein